ncbi:MAG: leucine-rich repeat domain-containing protein [Lewinellaceae bacterium]|nr:leucine-rich repeat domain-containing protein [Lewinellaceae bacterium]
MKSSISILLFCLLAIETHAQNNYTQAIQQGDAALRRGEYKTAIKKYFAAEAFDPSKKDVVQRKVETVFDKIEALRVEAERAFRQVQAEQEKTQAALDRADRLVEAFYFYAGRFALAYNDYHYYFIDKNGNPIEKLGYWGEAGQFTNEGFARVSPYDVDTIITFDTTTYEERVQIRRTSSLDYFLIDTTGKKYLVSTDEPEKEPGIAALGFSFNQLKEFPEKIFNYPALEILELNGNEIEKIPPRIGTLKQLRFLYLSQNNINSLPSEIGELIDLERLYLKGNDLTTLPIELGRLTKLKILDLENNPIHQKEVEKIQKLLPNCLIRGGYSYGAISSLYWSSERFQEAYDYAKKSLEEKEFAFDNSYEWATLELARNARRPL